MISLCCCCFSPHQINTCTFSRHIALLCEEKMKELAETYENSLRLTQDNETNRDTQETLYEIRHFLWTKRNIATVRREAKLKEPVHVETCENSLTLTQDNETHRDRRDTVWIRHFLRTKTNIGDDHRTSVTHENCNWLISTNHIAENQKIACWPPQDIKFTHSDW